MTSARLDGVVIAGGVRTPYARIGSDLGGLSAAALAAACIREVLARAGLDRVDEVVLGCGGAEAAEPNVARVATLRAGLPDDIPAFTVQRNCASGMEAVVTGALRIQSGLADTVLVGGTESMTRYPLMFPEAAKGPFERLGRARSVGASLSALGAFRPRHFKPRIAVMEGLTDPTCGEIMGLTAERLAREFGIGRAEQDEFALYSHLRAAAARAALATEILPIAGAKGWVEEDNGVREEQSIEALAKLRPVFDRRHGSVTVGNSCQVTDGACVLLLAREGAVAADDVQGRLRSFAVRSLEPERMGLGPAFALPAACDEAGAASSGLQVVELNEAFAAQVLACNRAMDSTQWCDERLGRSAAFGAPDPEVLNRQGGAIALGHPVGSTGARLVLTVLRQLEALDGSLGAATLCIGGGQGEAVVIER